MQLGMNGSSIKDTFAKRLELQMIVLPELLPSPRLLSEVYTCPVKIRFQSSYRNNKSVQSQVIRIYIFI